MKFDLQDLSKIFPDTPLKTVLFVIECTESALRTIKYPVTTKKLVKSIPTIVVANYGYLSDVVLNTVGITTYKQIGEIFKVLIDNKFYRVSKEDNISDFDIDDDIKQQVLDSLKYYPELIDNKLQTNGKNSSNPY